MIKERDDSYSVPRDELVTVGMKWKMRCSFYPMKYEIKYPEIANTFIWWVSESANILQKDKCQEKAVTHEQDIYFITEL